MPTSDSKPHVQYVSLSCYAGASLLRNVVTGRSVKGIIDLAKNTSINFYSMKRVKIETEANDRFA